MERVLRLGLLGHRLEPVRCRIFAQIRPGIRLLRLSMNGVLSEERGRARMRHEDDVGYSR